MLLSGISKQRAAQRKAEIERSLIHHEAKIGGELFGPIAPGHRREFFCLDERTWVWHEEWKDDAGKHHAVTTRYDVRPSQILKSQGHFAYQALSKEEEKNFFQAVKLYMDRIQNDYRQIISSQS